MPQFHAGNGSDEPGGEIIAITSAGYGAFGVPMSVTVMGAPRVAASLSATSDSGISIIAGVTDHVVTRGLNINATGSLSTAFSATIFGTLAIEGCTVKGGFNGVVVEGPSGSLATVTDTTVRGALNAGFGLGSPYRI